MTSVARTLLDLVGGLDADRLGPYVVDPAWPREKVAVELDGFDTHRSLWAFERDRARDRWLAAAGWLTLRVTWRQLVREGAAVVADVQAVLERRRLVLT